MGIGGTIFVFDKKGGQKACWRCGYSLAHIAGARNCPECGLAVRITFSGNSSLEWCDPRWQRYLAFAFGVLAFGLLCRMLSSAGHWAIFFAGQGNYRLGDTELRVWM